MFGPIRTASLVLLGMMATASGHGKQSLVRSTRNSLRAEGFVKALGFKHKLRVCNAFPVASALDIIIGKSEKLNGDEPMAYKTCRDMTFPLKAGDKLEFKIGEVTAGTFSVNDVPNNDATLFLVVHRHDTLSSAVAFESHVFANLANPQVAIIDTYKGKAHAMPRIKDAQGSNTKARSEELRYNSVVAVNPGMYEVELDGDDGETKASSQLVALSRESYVVLRTGVEAQEGESYPQSLVVFPRSDPKVLQKPVQVHSGAQQMLRLPTTIVAAVLALCMSS
jgi:phosphoribosylformylglycinamidine (FGAM) synthase PurS component